MKVKRIIVWHFLLASMAVFATTGLASKCINNAERWYNYYKTEGVPTRVYSGWYKGRPHRWCEYWNGHEWVMARDTINHVNDGWVRPDGYTVRRRIK